MTGRRFSFWCERCPTRITVETEVPYSAPNDEPQYIGPSFDGVSLVRVQEPIPGDDGIEIAELCPACGSRLHVLDDLVVFGHVRLITGDEDFSKRHAEWRDSLLLELDPLALAPAIISSKTESKPAEGTKCDRPNREAFAAAARKGEPINEKDLPKCGKPAVVLVVTTYENMGPTRWNCCEDCRPRDYAAEMKKVGQCPGPKPWAC